MAPGHKDAVRGAFNDIHIGVDFWEPIDYSLIKVSSPKASRIRRLRIRHTESSRLVDMPAAARTACSWCASIE